MSIKKIITGLAFSMLLGSGAANADWGDVYYCHMTNFFTIKLEGEKINRTPEKFQFKLDQTKNAMVMGRTGYFGNQVFELRKDFNFPEQESWYANDKYSMTKFQKGRLLYSSISWGGASTVAAECDKF
jgi:hypothetical protein